MATNGSRTGTSRTSSRRSGGDRKQTSTSSGERSASGGRSTARTATVDLPFVTATFHKPEMTLPAVRLPDRKDVDAAVQTVQPYLPSPQQAAYYGALAALAAVELIEWPVALAIGAGTAVVQRAQRSGPGGGRQRSGREAQTEAAS